MKCKSLTCSEEEQQREVLLLNSSEEVLAVIDWSKAINLIFTGKATKPSNFEDYHEIKTTQGVYKLPTAIILINYVYIPYKACPLTRKNILKRDDNKCQYCGKYLKKGEFTIDHLLPKSRGGENNWTNLVASCYKCNSRKSNRTPKEANMKLLKEPKEPKREYLHIIGINTITQMSWTRWIEIT